MTLSDTIREIYQDDNSLSYTEISELLECSYGQVHQVLTKFKEDNKEPKLPLSYLQKALNAVNPIRAKKWIVNHCDDESFKDALTDISISKYSIEKGKIIVTINEGKLYEDRYETLFNTSLNECISVFRSIFPLNTVIKHQQLHLCYQAEIQL